MSSHRNLSPVQHGILRERRPFLYLLRIIGTVVAVISIATASLGAITLYSFNSKIQNNAVELETSPVVKPVELQPIPSLGSFKDGANILLVGSDSGSGNPAYGERDASLNDVTILIHLNKNNTGISVISFPRDTFVGIPECTDPITGEIREAVSETKLNEALSRGGLNCVAKTIEQLTGASIPYAAMIEFDGVVQMSNAIGGVTVCVDAAISDDNTGLYLNAGENTLQGSDALAFLRTRYGVGDGSDLGRISNQQVFFSALVRTIKSDSTLTDIPKLFRLADAAVNNVFLSTSLASPTTMVIFAMALKEVPLDRIVFTQYPTIYGSSGSQSGVFPAIDAALALVSAVMNEQPIALTGGTAPGEIGSIVVDTTPPDASSTAIPVDTVPLPPEVTGQIANQVTCSNSN